LPFNLNIMPKGFEQIFESHARTVTLFSATRKESNITGTESLSYPETGTSITVIFFKTRARFDWSETGLDEYGDYVIFDKPNNNNLSKDDKIEAGGETFIIQAIRTWHSGADAVYDIASAVKVS